MTRLALVLLVLFVAGCASSPQPLPPDKEAAPKTNKY